MGSLKQEALEYEPITTKTVADLEVFDVNMNLETFKGVNNEGKNFAYKYITDKEGVSYRVPWKVISQIKVFLEDKPDSSLFKVKKTGEGMKTVYTVMPVNK